MYFQWIIFITCNVTWTNYRYEESDWGWKDKDKYAEMTEDRAQYLVAFDVTTGKPVAFTHFRFDMELDDEVVYWWDYRAPDTALLNVNLIWMNMLTISNMLFMIFKKISTNF